MDSHQNVMEKLNKRGRDSKKFVFSMIAFGILSAISVIMMSLVFKTQSTVDLVSLGMFIASVIGSLSAIPITYMTGASWLEKNVNTAIINKPTTQENG